MSMNLLNTVKTQKRTLRRVLFLFLFRVSLFSGLHMVYHVIHETKKKGGLWATTDVIAVSCCCWLAITLFLGIIEGGRMVFGARLKCWKRTMDPIPIEIDDEDIKESDDEHSSKKTNHKAGSILLIPHTDWYVKKYRDVVFTRCMEVQGLCNDSLTADTSKGKQNDDHINFKLFVTPWALWYYVYACGISLFVFGYSLTGLSFLSEISALISCVIVFPIIFKNKHQNINCTKVGSWFPVQILSTIGIAISLCMMAIGYTIHSHDSMAAQWISNNIWLGILLPVICSSLLCKCSEQANAMRLSPERVLMFAMPSLAMLSVTYLSFFIPTIMIQDECPTTVITNSKDQLAEAFDNISKAIFNNDNKNNSERLFNKTLTQESDFYLQFWAWSNSSQMQAMRSFFEARKGFDFFLEDGNPLLSVFVLISPLMLWCTMVTIIGAASRGISNTQSALSGYTLVLTVQQYLLKSSPYWVIAAMVIIVPSCTLAILAEVYDDSETQECGCRRLKSKSIDMEDDDDDVAAV
jgi:hypothetical protein